MCVCLRLGEEEGRGEESRHFDRFYMALFSALEQTHCILVACWISLGDSSPLYIYGFFFSAGPGLGESEVKT